MQRKFNLLKKTMSSLLLLLLVSVLNACTTGPEQNKNTAIIPEQNKTAKVLTITPEDAKERLENEENIILLDVRTLEEYEENHIPNSVLIPLDVLEKEASEKLSDKGATIFIYCRSGNRSATASKILLELGYTNLYDLGGIIDWPYDTESGQ